MALCCAVSLLGSVAHKVWEEGGMGRKWQKYRKFYKTSSTKLG